MAEAPLRLLVIGNLPPHVLGGAENQVARLVEAWCAAGIKVEVAGHRIPKGEQVLGTARVRTHRIHTWTMGGRTGRALSYLLSLTRLVLRRRRDFDAVYCRGMGDGLVGVCILATIGVCPWPIIAVPINARGNGDAAFLRSIPGWRLWVRLLDRRISAINLINADIAEDLDALGLLNAPRSIIPNGISVQAPVLRKSVAPARRLLWTGRFEYQKGLDLLLPVLARFRSGRARFHVDLVGEGVLRSVLEQQMRALGLQDVVRFLGAVEAKHVRELLIGVDVFLLPSRYEGMSNAALEAMEAGLPVLCTRCGGIDAVVAEGAGWVCEPDDEASLAACFDAMLMATDDEILARGRLARNIVERRFRIEQVATANLELIRGVMRGVESR
ncbi:glycosyltransferase family 4 protein [Luteimonas suaedae]|uniref:glycosyltransferase family 4 protein n=1 Tax=Luteimonas suaedae TaxID=2605430 RepID=UPI0011EE3124|nr:glycosyltransferase family 4 protein [Luteimonas suaedae]